MKVIQPAPTIPYGIAYSFTELKRPNYSVTLYLSGDTSNCKLSYIHAVGNLKNATDDAERKEIIDHMLALCKGTVLFNTIDKNVAEFLARTYQHYYYETVPIGYSGGFQYHILVRNQIKVNLNCRDVLPKVKASAVDKEAIKVRLKALLKTKKRKDDYVDEFINSI